MGDVIFLGVGGGGVGLFVLGRYVDEEDREMPQRCRDVATQ